VLPAETDRVWDFLKDQPALAGFVLIGGTALALRIHHRRSEDLDFAFPEDRLPRTRLEALRRLAAEAGFEFREEQDEIAGQEFEEAGLDLRDFQQNHLVNRSVKVSFFAADHPLRKVLTMPSEGRARVATLPELFKSKALVSASRSKTRDWLDLYLLLREHGFSIRDFQQAFYQADVESQCATALGRLCSGVPQRDDEGYVHLLSNPPSLAEIKGFFVSQRDRLEIELAAEAARKRQRGE
jgi:hypothetical protein